MEVMRKFIKSSFVFSRIIKKMFFVGSRSLSHYLHAR